MFARRPVGVGAVPGGSRAGGSYPSGIAIYLDNNATTQPTPETVEAVASSLRDAWHNPSSTHRAGQRARAAIELARRDVAELLGVRARELTFTGSGTESIDLAVRGVIGAWRIRDEQSRAAAVRLVTTRVEHAAVRDLAIELERTGAVAATQFAPIGSDGVVDLAALSALLHDPDWGLTLVSVQWANNETGVVQPIEAIHACCAEHNAIFHCDAVQWVGKMSMDDARDLHDATREHATPAHRHAGPGLPSCDLLSFSPHKFHGVKGVGGLWVRQGVKLRPTLVGTQELGRRGGTENVPGIIGAGVAASQAREWLEDEASRRSLRMLRDRFERMVTEACPGSRVNAGASPRLWNTSNIAFPRLEAEALLLAMSERGLCASAGAACSSGSLDPSPVLLAMGVPEPEAHGSIRFSLSRFTTREELDDAVRIIALVVAKLRETLPV